MDKAALRQKVIVGIAVLAVLYAIFDMTILSRSKGGASKTGEMSPAELQAFVAQTAVETGKSARTDFYVAVVDRAEKPWGRNPFSVSGTGGSTGVKRAGFTYSGYVQAGNKGLAIIDNFEYQVGEELEKGGYFVKEINSSRVIIENRPAKTEIEVPLHD